MTAFPWGLAALVFLCSNRIARGNVLLPWMTLFVNVLDSFVNMQMHDTQKAEG
jgi:hypothetical protein